MRHGFAVVLALALLAPVGAGAADDVGRVKVVKGSVTIQRSGGGLPATVGMKLQEGDVIATGRDGAPGHDGPQRHHRERASHEPPTG